MIEHLGSQEHVIQHGGISLAGLVKLITVQVNAALAYILIRDLHPVGL